MLDVGCSQTGWRFVFPLRKPFVEARWVLTPSLPGKGLATHVLAALIGILLAASLAAAAEPASITIDLNHPGHRAPRELYGIFFEEINHAGEGGLYAEMVRRRDFQAGTIPAGWRGEGQNSYTRLGSQPHGWFTNDLRGWSLLTEGGAEGEIALESAELLSDRHPHSLRLTVTKRGKRCGVVNDGSGGMDFQAGKWYDLTFYARTESNRHFGLIVSLESEDGRNVCERATLPEVGGPWKKYTLALHARQSEPKGRLVIALSDPGTIWLDEVSLIPRETYKKHGMRTDPSEMLAALRPGFQRFPGGRVVEGVAMKRNSDFVVPAESKMDLAGAEFSYEFKPNSPTILRLPVGLH